MSRQRAAAVLVAAALGLAACTPAPGDAAPGATGAPSPPSGDQELAGTLTVFAAASLTDAFAGLGDRLEEQHPGLEVRFTFAGSSGLAAQLLQGAPADVYASADESQMARVVDAGLARDPEVFAQNVLMVAVPTDNPGNVSGLGDFAREELDLAVCAPEVPCGSAAQQLFDVADVAAVPDTYEEDVRAVLTKVQLGEVDAGLVWFSDVVAAGPTILAFAPREAVLAETEYPIAALTAAPNPEAARAFVELVLSKEGRAALSSAGFHDR
ncbi:MAG: molybdate ABC transporter substrate-binding protein [Actinomycetes bacterium]